MNMQRLFLLLLQKLIIRKLKKKLSRADELWCELALALGGTIGELQTKMGKREFDLWCMYLNKYGTLNPVRKYDRGFALLASLIANSNGGKTVPNDFITYGKEEKDPTIEEFIKATFGSGVKIGKRR